MAADPSGGPLQLDWEADSPYAVDAGLDNHVSHACLILRDHASDVLDEAGGNSCSRQAGDPFTGRAARDDRHDLSIQRVAIHQPVTVRAKSGIVQQVLAPPPPRRRQARIVR